MTMAEISERNGFRAYFRTPRAKYSALAVVVALCEQEKERREEEIAGLQGLFGMGDGDLVTLGNGGGQFSLVRSDEPRILNVRLKAVERDVTQLKRVVGIND
jgi:hypothetical protein